MNTQPATTPRRRTSSSFRLSSAPLKRDINLVSNEAAKARTARRVAFLLLGLVVAALVGYVAFAVPLLLEQNLNRELQEAQSQMEGVAADTQFTDLTAQRDQVKAMVDLFTTLESEDYTPSELLTLLQGVCPKSTTLLSVSMTTDSIQLIGRAKVDRDVAQLVVNLQQSGVFRSVSLLSVEDADVLQTEAATEDTNEPAATPESNLRLFTVNAAFPPRINPLTAPVDSAAPTAATAESTQGGDNP